ncbi:MAG TPA: HEAT repeat domain-containing protein [Chloroflexia bacterium]|nr:HEAT repeat domain-containing protein [Chloroflexia bacterium]
MVTGLVVLVTARGFAVRLRRIYALILFLAGLFLTGLSLPEEPDSGFQKLGGNIALAASLAVIACMVVLAILLYPFTVDGWRVRGESGFLKLIQRLDHPDSLFRAQAAEFLGELGDQRAVEPLIDALQDEESAVRANAAIALGRLGDIRALPALHQAGQDPNRFMGTRPLADVVAEAIAALEEQPQNK